MAAAAAAGRPPDLQPAPRCSLPPGCLRASAVRASPPFSPLSSSLRQAVLLTAECAPVVEHESYRPNNVVNGQKQETCRQWKMIYRWMPSEHTQKMKAKRLAMVAG